MLQSRCKDATKNGHPAVSYGRLRLSYVLRGGNQNEKEREMLYGEQGQGSKEGKLIPERKMASEKLGEGAQTARRPGDRPAQGKGYPRSWKSPAADTPTLGLDGREASG